ncbi:hypothetical protein [Helicobacter sp. 13S00477-4]|uniref:hypothetical protein n=1 Tax=Helicobacter sp. 13S00477-4 TaxID=1905759 RepID=UPI000BA7AA02|nr:hypothetical protein [Helicobacter sp. 13S00477-4]PAF50651.1 hypothetical protein BKH44_07350 [Helicobacter sp. 13S00477-4]
MKKIVFILMVLLVCIGLAKKEFNIRDFYNNSQANTPQNPNDFSVQDTLNGIFSEDVLDAANSENPDSFKDAEVGDKFKDSKGVSSFVEAEKKGTRKELITTTVDKLGNIAKSTGRATCYIARGENFFQYQCSINGITTPIKGSGDVDSPLNAKKRCEETCITPSKCVVATNPLDTQKEDVENIITDAIVLSKKNPKQQIEKNFKPDKKTKNFIFTIKNNADMRFDFSYTDESGYERILARGLLLKAQDEKTITDGGLVKKYTINNKVKSIKMSFYISDKVDLDQYDDEDKKLIATIIKPKLLIPKINRFVSEGMDIFNKPALKNACSKKDLVTLKVDGRNFQICKTNSTGDNEDGTFSNEKTCSASSFTRGFCTLREPALNVESFFNIKEGCLEGTKNCSAETCKEARNNAAPILNERVFDAKGNVVETIVNGGRVAGTIRPRIIAEPTDYENTIETEGKDRAYINMINDQQYASITPISKSRKTSYAIKTKKNQIFIKIKPSDDFYDKKMYVYVMLALQTVDKTGQKSKLTLDNKYYYLADNSGKFHSFFLSNGYNVSNNMDNSKKEFAHFDSVSKIWNGLDKNQKAEIFKAYDNVLSSVKKNKYFIEEKLIDDKVAPLLLEGPVKSRVYAVSYDYSDLSVNTNPDSEAEEHFRVVGEFYYPMKTDKDIPSSIRSLNSGEKLVRSVGDIPMQYEISVLASSKPLTYQEIADALIYRDTTGENLIYNYLDDKKHYISILRDDALEPNQLVSIYLTGNLKKLSAYASFRPKNGEVNGKDDKSDIRESGYSFLWWGKNQRDVDKGSILNLAPSDKKPFAYYEHLSPSYDLIPLFEDKDMSDKASEQLNFGYGSGDYDSSSDCKVFTAGGITKKICLPWWRIEREYDEKIDKIIPDKGFQKAMRALVVPMVGKMVEVCTKIDPNANSFFNKDTPTTLNCTSYYNKLAGEDCFTNPMQKKCFVDNCPIKVKQNCKLKSTLDFGQKDEKGNELATLKTKISVPDKSSADNSEIQLEGTRLALKTYTYECPAVNDVEINQVCLQTETVTMNPADCSDIRKDGVELSKEDKSKIAGDIIRLKSDYTYCDTNRPIMDSLGNLTGFKGTCATNQKEVVCGINQVQRTTRTCVLPIFKTELYDDVKTQEIQKECKDVSVNIMKGDEDIYASDPTCLRMNTAADSRKGIVSATFSNNKVGGTFIVSKNYKDTQKIEYCKYDGVKSSLLPSDCSDNAHQVMNFTSTITDSKEILFAEQIGVLSNGGVISGIKSLYEQDVKVHLPTKQSDTSVSDIKIPEKRKYKCKVRRGRRGSSSFYHFDALLTDKEFKEIQKIISTTGKIYVLSVGGDFVGRKIAVNGDHSGDSCELNGGASTPDVDVVKPKPHTMAEQAGGLLNLSNEYWKLFEPYKYRWKRSIENNDPLMTLIEDSYKANVDFSSEALNGMVGYSVIQLMPEVSSYNFETSRWFEPEFKLYNIMANSPDKPWDCHCISNFCDWYKTQTPHDYKCPYHSFKALKVYNNATLGLNIILPTPSDYEFYFYDKDGKVIAKEDIPRTKVTALPAGFIQALPLVSKLRTPRANELEKKLIPAKEKEIADLKEKYTQLSPIKKIKTIAYGYNEHAQNIDIGKKTGRTNDWGFWYGGNGPSKLELCVSRWGKESNNWGYPIGYEITFENFNGVDDTHWFNTLGFTQYEQWINGELKEDNFDDKIKIDEAKKSIDKKAYDLIGRLSSQGVPFSQLSHGSCSLANNNSDGHSKDIDDICISKFDRNDVPRHPLEYKKSGKQLYHCKSESKYDFSQDETWNLYYESKEEAERNDDIDNDMDYTCELVLDSNGKPIDDMSIPIPGSDYFINNGKNTIVDCKYYQPNYEKELIKLEKELKELQDELKDELPRSCSNDPFSPVGGGTLFGIETFNGTSSCPFNRSMNYIRNYSVYSIAVIDKETGDRTVKKLTYPMPFLNRIYFTYLKSVEERKYKCCSAYQDNH